MSMLDKENKPGTDVAEAPPDTERTRIRSRLQARRDFGSHLAAYVVFNGCLIAIWALTGGGYFWPAWVLGIWGAGLLLHAWETFGHRPITEADIDAEMRRAGP